MFLIKLAKANNDADFMTWLLQIPFRCSATPCSWMFTDDTVSRVSQALSDFTEELDAVQDRYLLQTHQSEM